MKVLKNCLGLAPRSLLTLVTTGLFAAGGFQATAMVSVAQSLPESEPSIPQPEVSSPEQPSLPNTSNFSNPWQEEENSVQQQNEQENLDLQQEFAAPDNNVEEPGLPAPNSGNSQEDSQPDDTSVPLQ
ncbi:MAG TPA: hypothetical protein V6C65_29000 [Allocoleopsis sp.]